MFKIRFCNQCGAETESQIPSGDDRLRDVCVKCDFVQYQNPRVIVGTLPTYGRKVLLCRRAIEPRRGYWTLPAGFMECDETAAEGARRETQEEAGADLSALHLYGLYDVPQIAQLYMFYRAEIVDGFFLAGEESLEVALFDEAEIPWRELAFPTIEAILQRFYRDREIGCFDLIEDTINYPVMK